MPNIKPVSDLRNYAEILRDVDNGSTVYLTKNGRGRYVILDMKEYEKLIATVALANALNEGRVSGEEKGWTAQDELKVKYGL